jgi:DNA polymerase-1
MAQLIDACELCPLKGMAQVDGELVGERADIVIVGIHPGVEEGKAGKPFVGAGGKILREALNELGITNYYLTNIIRCVVDSIVGEDMIERIANLCKHHVVDEIKKLKPKVIIALGATPRRILSEFFSDVKSVVHPAFAIRMKGTGAIYNFKNELKAALSALGAGAHPPALTSISSSDVRYTVVKDEATATAFRRSLANSPYIVVDCEVGSKNNIPLDPSATLRCCGVTFSDGNTFILPFPSDLSTQLIKEAMGTRKLKVAHNWIFDWVVLFRLGATPKRPLMDTLLLAHAYREDEFSYSLKALCKKYLGTPDWSIPNEPAQILTCDEQTLFSYCAKDTFYTNLLFRQLLELTKGNTHIKTLLEKVTIPAIFLYALASHKGVKVDFDWMREVEEALARRLERIEKELQASVGYKVNPLSVDEVGRLVYEKLKLPVIERTPKSGKPSTKEEVLAELYNITKNETLKLIIDYRATYKLLSSYIETVKASVCTDGRVRPSWQLHGTVTGRVVCQKPALQTLPRSGEDANNIRGIFVPDEGKCFVELDFKTHEVRVLLNLAKEALGAELIKAGMDIHTYVASELFRKKQDEVTKEERQTAKGIVFGLLYGMSPTTLARNIGISDAEAYQFVEKLYSLFPSVRGWQRRQIEFAKSVGYVVTPCGRRRHFYDVETRYTSVINTPVQSYASDLCLMAASKFLLSAVRDIPNYLTDLDPVVLLTIHDAVLIECSDAEGAVRRFVEAVEQVEKEEGLIVPLGLECAIHKERWQLTEKETCKP